MSISRSDRGFSLLELAIVLFILGILLVGVLVPLAVQQEQK
ncbi:MAG: prepilin-type N-terminal cleavage/methylation domain-containing protein [Gammaproteobacteria bacterium]|nr:prepilin-type N-terminal cleavage/methylation domain-containing protein [Gammaproteobacteria bacterium]